jgi:hypothetical protein
MQKARSFVPRAPRYEYQELDPKVLRFSTDKNVPLEAYIYNLSLTGVAFIVKKSAAPAIGDVLKVELGLPLPEEAALKNPKKMAWFGKVARIENKKTLPWWLNQKAEDFTTIGIHFIDLPISHSQMIQTTLDQCWVTLRKKRWQEHWRRALLFYSKKSVEYATYAIAVWAAFLFFKHFTKPDSDYDASRGSPWGQRFKINRWFSE